MSESLRIATTDGAFNAFVSLPARLPAPAVVVLHEVFGVNEDMRQTCRNLSAQGFIAVCPDLFWRQEPGLDLNNWSEAEWKRGLELYRAFDLTLGPADISAVVEQVGNMEGCTGRVAVLGFCLGGLLAYLTAARFPVDAAVAYYGGATEQHLDEASALHAPLLMHLAGEDEFMPEAARQSIRNALSSNPEVEIHLYPGQCHAFARNTGTHYHAPSAELANGRSASFLHRHLDRSH